MAEHIKPKYIDTFYRRTISGSVNYPNLQHEHSTQVLVIGAGLAGLTCTLELAYKGFQVTAIDTNKIGWGASGRNGGSVSPAWSANSDAILHKVGRNHFDELYRLSMEGVSMVKEYATRLAANTCPLQFGHLKVSTYNNSDAFMRFCDDQNKRYGRELKFLDQDEVKQLLNSPRYYQGVYANDGFHFHPLNYCHALAKEASRLGANIFENTPATTISRSNYGFKVKTPLATIDADIVVICTGGYTGSLVPKLQQSFLPIATYIMLSEPLGNELKQSIKTRAAIGDTRRAGNYYRIVDGNRLQWGGHITTRTTDPENITRILKKELALCYPQLKDIPIAITWSGLMSYARHMMPQVGMLENNLWYCTAFGGHGVNTTSAGARTVAEAISGESDRYRLFRPFGLVWNGGQIGKVAVQLTYWKYQLQDLMKEHCNLG